MTSWTRMGTSSPNLQTTLYSLLKVHPGFGQVCNFSMAKFTKVKNLQISQSNTENWWHNKNSVTTTEHSCWRNICLSLIHYWQLFPSEFWATVTCAYEWRFWCTSPMWDKFFQLETTRFTLVLGCVMDGACLPSMIFSKRKTLPKGARFPTACLQEKAQVAESTILDQPFLTNHWS